MHSIAADQAPKQEDPKQKPVEEEKVIPDLQEEMEGEDEREPKLYVDVNVANFGL